MKISQITIYILCEMMSNIVCITDQRIPEHSVVLFQTCGHNPTGVDPTVSCIKRSVYIANWLTSEHVALTNILL